MQVNSINGYKNNSQKTDFGNIDKTVREGLGKLSPRAFERTLPYWRALEKSDVVDLFLTQENKLALLTKKPLKILENGKTLETGTVIKLNEKPWIYEHKTNVGPIIIDSVDISGEDKKLFLDFGPTDLSHKAYDVSCGIDKDGIPGLGVLIDWAHKMEEPIQKLKELANSLTF